jgi:hypothetical protein
MWAGVGDWGLSLSMYIYFEHSQCRCLFKREMPIIGQRKHGGEEESARGGRAERGPTKSSNTLTLRSKEFSTH